MAYAFTNAQIRSILNGMGFKKRGANELNFPISIDNSSLSDDVTKQAIKSFQTYFNLTPDGIVGDKTKTAAEKAMNVLHYELDLVMQPNPPLRPQAPLYGPQFHNNFVMPNSYPITALDSQARARLTV